MAIQSSENVDDDSPKKGFSKILQLKFKCILMLPLGAFLFVFLSLPIQAEGPEILNGPRGRSRPNDWKFLGRGTTTFYGCCGDGYFGRHPAAYWHGERGLPDRVNLDFFGVAVSDRAIPFGTRLCLTIYELPGWAKEEYTHLRGRSVEVIVIDRMRSPTGQYFDLWPAAAKQLMGPDFQRLGKVYVVAEKKLTSGGRTRGIE